MHDLAVGLRDLGHQPHVLSSRCGATRRSVQDGVEVTRSMSLPEGLLRSRGFTSPLTHMPLMLRFLVGGDYDLAHAFSPADAAVALFWRRLSGRPVVFTCVETLRRDGLADGRLRLSLLRAAVDDSDAVITAGEEACAALSRWLAVEAAIMEPSDARAHERLYRGLGGIAER